VSSSSSSSSSTGGIGFAGLLTIGIALGIAWLIRR
jgi:hypothetical protein